jgi:hypothetical protein
MFEGTYRLIYVIECTYNRREHCDSRLQAQRGLVRPLLRNVKMDRSIRSFANDKILRRFFDVPANCQLRLLDAYVGNRIVFGRVPMHAL